MNKIASQKGKDLLIKRWSSISQGTGKHGSWRCTVPTCKGRLRTLGADFRVPKEHNHAPNSSTSDFPKVSFVVFLHKELQTKPRNSRNYPGKNRCPASEGSSSQPAAPLHLSLSFQDLHSQPHLFISHFLFRIITGDETWVHNFTPDTKSALMTWMRPSSPVTKRFKVTHSTGKVMMTAFCALIFAKMVT
ncbi:hypothetical protein AVEN_118931-1 [Araneus ventricosus]|uniref:FLYWCH-type domain-containing protein n=1 Tax=Araneus ventricosus TaxID=182803 RepID=A0A4Y2BX95_ARAVE|nr:hypothetical protein AVEN_118931-1 [Araneus ventricosus]